MRETKLSETPSLKSLTIVQGPSKKSSHPLDSLIEASEKLKRPITLLEARDLLKKNTSKKILLKVEDDKNLTLLLRLRIARRYITEIPHVTKSSEAFDIVASRYKGIEVYFNNSPELLHNFSLQFIKRLLEPVLTDQADLVSSANSLLLRKQLPIIQSMPLLIKNPKKFMKQLSLEREERIQKRCKKEQFLSLIIECLLTFSDRKKELTRDDFIKFTLATYLSHYKKNSSMGYDDVMRTIGDFFGSWEKALEDAHKAYLLRLSQKLAKKSKGNKLT